MTLVSHTIISSLCESQFPSFFIFIFFLSYFSLFNEDFRSCACIQVHFNYTWFSNFINNIEIMINILPSRRNNKLCYHCYVWLRNIVFDMESQYLVCFYYQKISCSLKITQIWIIQYSYNCIIRWNKTFYSSPIRQNGASNWIGKNIKNNINGVWKMDPIRSKIFAHCYNNFDLVKIQLFK